MKITRIAVATYVLLGVLGTLRTAAIADTSSETQRAEANIRVLSFASDVMQSQSPAEFLAWPLPLRDTLTYWMEYRPFFEWSPELQKLALNKFGELANDATDRSEMKPSVAQWLKEPEPTRNAELRFMLLIDLSLRSASAGFSSSHRIYQLIEKKTAYDIQELSSFLSGLSQGQRKELLSSKMRLPVAHLTEKQKSVIKSMFGDSPIFVGGPPLHGYADAKIAVDFQFGASVRRSAKEKQEYFYTLIARPFDYSADYNEGYPSLHPKPLPESRPARRLGAGWKSRRSTAWLLAL